MAREELSGPPTRIVVRGSSTVSWIALAGSRGDVQAYPRAMESALHRSGRPAQVRVAAPLAASSRHILRDADDEIYGWAPEVIILNTGHMENLHMLLPIPFARHVFTRTARPGRWRGAYRRGLLWPVYSLAVRVQARLEPALGSWIFGRRRAAVLAHITRYINVARGNGSPLVVVMGFVPPAKPPAAFPGVAARLGLMNDAYRSLVAERAEPDTVWFDPADALTAAGFPLDEAVGDGIHFTPDAHVVVGRALADVVREWTSGRAQLEQEQDVVDTEE